MREPRNPFRLRASEHIESEETFIRLFSPDILDILRDEGLWDKPQIVRSAPGGGKTSLFRLFTPRSLMTVHALRTHEFCKDLFGRLEALGAVDDNRPLVLGVLLSCAQSYSMLDDLSIDTVKKQRLLLSLMNARFILGILQGALVLNGLKFPTDLGYIKFISTEKSILNSRITLPDDGNGLYNWAMQLEKSVCDALDSFVPLTDNSLPGHDSLLPLEWISNTTLTVKNQRIVTKLLLMLDDVHRLTSNQRRFLLDIIISARPPIAIWLAERLEALDITELFATGTTQGRDYGSIVTIEEYWRGNKNKRFEKVISNVADRRAKDAKDIEMTKYAECLNESLDGSEWQGHYLAGKKIVEQRIRDKTTNHHKYSEWIKDRENFKGTPREIALAWRTLEILIERDQKNAQKAFDFALGTEEYEQKDVSSVRNAAELFFCKEFEIPYYYGLSRLADMASSNIEQFLWLAGDIFEESVSAFLLQKSSQLLPSTQERILKKAIKTKWETLSQQIRHGTDVCKFIESVGKFARWETDKPNAPYAPGVTGFAISMKDRFQLVDPESLNKNKDLQQLAKVISSCITHNLFEITLDQKCKGQYWMVIYLNRMLCVHFGLPLQYGGWREKSLKDLCKWISKGFSSPIKNGGLFS